jgi:uncharacterized repeat protein (TIGR02543 family)
VNCYYYDKADILDNTGRTARVGGAFEPEKQAFRLMDGGSAEINKSGVVFRDLNKNGIYDAGEEYKGVTVELYAEDKSNAGDPEAVAVASAFTDENGQYEFKNLWGGNYFIKVVLPQKSTAAVNDGADVSYSYIEKDATTTEAVDSNVDDGTGFSEMFSLDASGSVSPGVNAGIVAKGIVRVVYKTANGDIVKTETDDEVADFDPADATKAGTIEPGVTAGYSLPANYHLAKDAAGAKDYLLIFGHVGEENLYQKLIFDVELDYNMVSFDGNGATSGTMTDNTHVDYGTDYQIPENEFVRTGYAFNGWTASGSKTGNYADKATIISVTGDVVLTAAWEQIRYTVKFVDFDETQIGDVQSVIYGQDATEETHPTRDGYTFTGWDKSFTGVLQDLTVRAQYKKNDDPKPPTITPPAITPPAITPPAVKLPKVKPPVPPTPPTPTISQEAAPVTVPPEPEETTPEPDAIEPTVSVNTVTPVQTPEQEVVPPVVPEGEITHREVVEALRAAGVPVLNIGGLEIPLVGGHGFDTWALVNLILTIAGVILILVTLILWIRKRRDEAEDREFIYNNGSTLKGEPGGKNSGNLWLIIAAALSIVAAVFFMIAEDMSKTMVLLDKWTIVNAVILAIEIVAVNRTLKRKDREEAEQDAAIA